MRIVQLANFYHERSGGLRTAVDAFAAGYVAAGHDVALVVPGPSTGVTTIGDRTAITIRSPRLPGSGGYRTIVDRRAVRDVLARLRPDVIELSDRTTLARIVVRDDHAAPIVLFSHERLDLAVGRRVPGTSGPTHVVDAWTKRLLARVDVAVCASEFAGAELDALSPRPVRRVPLGVDLDAFSPWNPPVADAPSWSAGSHHRAVCVGRLSPEKHVRDSIAAIHQLVRSGRLTELLVVGDGPQRGELERLAAGLPVRFAGHVGDRAVVADVLRRADVAIVPSPAETFGLAALEALACGTPVVAAANGAVGELVVPGAGVVARPGVNGLAAAIATVFEGDRDERRRAARARAEEFSWARAVQGMLACHRDACGERQLSNVG
jgi:alpha-1,6-mannosyltransferase